MLLEATHAIFKIYQAGRQKEAILERGKSRLPGVVHFRAINADVSICWWLFMPLCPVAAFGMLLGLLVLVLVRNCFSNRQFWRHSFEELWALVR